MEIHQLRYFLALCEQEHFSNTAQFLGISQPALSRSIASLEKEIGIKFFDRYKNRVRLNENGKEFAAYVRQAFDLLQTGLEVSRQTKFDTRGILRIACHAFADNIIGCLNAYTELNPGIQIQLFQSHLADNHLADKVDFILSSDREAAMFSAEDNSWECQRLWPESLVILMTPQYREYPEDVEELAVIELKDDLFIGSALNGLYFSDPLNGLCHAAGFTPKIFCHTDDFITSIRFVAAGKAITILPESCIPIAQKIAPDLRIFRIKGNPYTRNLYMIRKRDSLLDEAALDFWKFMLDYYGLEYNVE